MRGGGGGNQLCMALHTCHVSTEDRDRRFCGAELATSLEANSKKVDDIPDDDI